MITKQWLPTTVLSRRFVGIVLAIALLALVALASWSTRSLSQPRSGATTATAWIGATRISEAGQVTIKATWQETSPAPAFQIVMDTHAVDLDGYDLTTLALMRTADGKTVQPTSWNAPQGGHHRTGTLIFPATIDGSAVIGPDTRSIELIIRHVGGVPERTLTWTR